MGEDEYYIKGGRDRDVVFVGVRPELVVYNIVHFKISDNPHE